MFFTQIRLMLNKREFRLVYFINMGYLLLTYLYYVLTSWGDDISTIPSPGAAFMLHLNQ